jgi:uncharacterized protein involved in exopolysaccharide biosynthesis
MALKQTPDKSNPPSSSYRETFRRHRKLFCIPVVLGVLAGAFFVFTSTPSYKSTASLWVDTAPPLASTVGAGPTNPLVTPPAASEQSILTELLTTQSFAASVAKNSSLGKSLGSAASIFKNAPTYLEAGQVVPTVYGQQLLRISYSGSSPAEAQSVLNAVVTQLRDYNNSLTADHNDAAVAYDKEQVKLAEATLAAARSNVNTYLAQHPGASQADPNLLALTAAENNAVTALGTANATLSQASATNQTGGWTIEVIDPANLGLAPAVGKKKMLEVILGGAIGGMLLSFLIVVAITPAKKELWEDELPVGTAFPSHAAPADPFRGQAPAPGVFANGHSPARTGVGHSDGPRLSTSERRFTFRRPSEHVED